MLLAQARTLAQRLIAEQRERELITRRIEPDQRLIARQDAIIAGLQKQRETSMLDAIAKTLIAYDIVPGRNGVPQTPSARSVVPGFEGPPWTWTIRYGVEHVRVSLATRSGVVHYPAPTMRERGRTTPDGFTVIWGEFSDPRLLALLLVHELRHFEQFTTPGKGDAWTRAEFELDAYAAERRAMAPMGLDRDRAFEKEMLDFFRAKGRYWMEQRPEVNASPAYGEREGLQLPMAGPVPEEASPVVPVAPLAPPEVDEASSLPPAGRPLTKLPRPSAGRLPWMTR